jgi:hypothetical protein
MYEPLKGLLLYFVHYVTARRATYLEGLEVIREGLPENLGVFLEMEHPSVGGH